VGGGGLKGAHAAGKNVPEGGGRGGNCRFSIFRGSRGAGGGAPKKKKQQKKKKTKKKPPQFGGFVGGVGFSIFGEKFKFMEWFFSGPRGGENRKGGGFFFQPAGGGRGPKGGKKPFLGVRVNWGGKQKTTWFPPLCETPRGRFPKKQSGLFCYPPHPRRSHETFFLGGPTGLTGPGGGKLKNLFARAERGTKKKKFFFPVGVGAAAPKFPLSPTYGDEKKKEKIFSPRGALGGKKKKKKKQLFSRGGGGF